MPSVKYLVKRYPVSETRVKFRYDSKTGEYEKITTNRPVMQQTLKACRDAAMRFLQYCHENFTVEIVDKRGRSKRRACRYPDECMQYIQQYADFLSSGEQKKSPSTVHTYISLLCRFYGVPLQQYQLPKRHVAEFTKGRGGKAVEKRKDTHCEASPRLYEFAQGVGCRRNEYLPLCGRNLVNDESGYLCVEVESGKGNKRQLQRILPQYVPMVKSYFEGVAPDEHLFTEKELNNKINLHRLRELLALENYRYYAERLRMEPGYRDQLRKELMARIEADNQYNIERAKKKGKRWEVRQWDEREFQGTYYLRGQNRALAQKHGAPVAYDKAALLAASIFTLAHYRSDVTIASYILPAHVVEGAEHSID